MYKLLVLRGDSFYEPYSPPSKVDHLGYHMCHYQDNICMCVNLGNLLLPAVVRSICKYISLSIHVSPLSVRWWFIRFVHFEGEGAWKENMCHQRLCTMAALYHGRPMFVVGGNLFAIGENMGHEGEFLCRKWWICAEGWLRCRETRMWCYGEWICAVRGRYIILEPIGPMSIYDKKIYTGWANIELYRICGPTRALGCLFTNFGTYVDASHLRMWLIGS